MRNSRLILSILALAICVFPLFAAEPFELKAGDRVAFIGDALIERDIQYNYLETMLTVRYHATGAIYRNIGWSGDTVWGESRAVFGTPADGYKALVKMIGEVKPTVAFFDYGMNESFAGAAGLEHFEAGYNTLLDDLEKTAKGCRVVLLSPIAFQLHEAGSIKPDPKINDNIKLYCDAIKKIAEKRGALFVDMFAVFKDAAAQNPKGPLTNNGMHLTATGYQFYAKALTNKLTGKDMPVNFSPVAGIYNPLPSKAPDQKFALEDLRRKIEYKNHQFFNRWRPQNDTYIFLFRKGEQGKNAKDIPEFDPIIAKMEVEITAQAAGIAKTMGL